MKGLAEFTASSERHEFWERECYDLKRFGWVDNNISHSSAVGREKAVGEIRVIGRIGRNTTEMKENPWNMTCFLKQFSCNRSLGRLGCLDCTTGKFQEGLLEPMAILPNQDGTTRGCERENVDPVWVLKHVVGLDSETRGQLTRVDPKREEAIGDRVSGSEDLPHTSTGSWPPNA